MAGQAHPESRRAVPEKGRVPSERPGGSTFSPRREASCISPAMPPVPRPPGLSELEPLSEHCSIGTGGPARWFCEVTTRDQLDQCLDWARERGLAVFLLGGGSNLVCADSGFDGLIIKVRITGLRFEALADRMLVHAGAGETWDALVLECCQRGLVGVECLSGIPGTVGATPLQNVGAYGQEVSQTLVSVTCLELESHEVLSFSAEQCEFGYRTSRFKERDRGRYAILEVCFALRHGLPDAPSYPELLRALAARALAQPTAEQLRACVLELRKSKSMLLDAADPNGQSCGSFFTNPILEASEFQALLTRALPARPPAFSETDGRFKVPAAWLIEQAGFAKGARSGNVGLSTKHTLCVVAHSGATSAEVVAWARHVRDTVFDRFGVELEPEPQLLGLSFGTRAAR